MASSLQGQIHSSGGTVFVGDGNAGRDIININHITTVRPLARSLRRSMRNSSAQFEPLQRDLGSLMDMLENVVEDGTRYDVDCDAEPVLSGLSRNCHEILDDLLKMKEHYDSVGTQTQITWDREQWRADELEDIRSRLDSATTSLNTVYSRLILSSAKNTMEKVEVLINEFRTGKRERSVVSNRTLSSLSADENEAWKQLRRELKSVGITPEHFTQHREQIVERLLRAISDGDLPEDIGEEPIDREELSDVAESPDIVEQLDAVDLSDALKIRPTPQTSDPIIRRDNMSNAARDPKEKLFQMESFQMLLKRGANLETKIGETPPSYAAPRFVPSRLLSYIDENFVVFETESHEDPAVVNFDIVSYIWGTPADPYNCGISGVTWDIKLSARKIEDIKRLMIYREMRYLWVDCLCIDQSDFRKSARDIALMPEYFRKATMCHILVDFDTGPVSDYQDILNELTFLDRLLSRMGGKGFASDAELSGDLLSHLASWKEREWAFPLSKSTARAAQIEMSVLNCYSTCSNYLRSLFDSPYFSRVWTLQEMLLGKNVTLWGTTDDQDSLSPIGDFIALLDLITNGRDKALKLRAWIESCVALKSASVSAILELLEEDYLFLSSQHTLIQGIISARKDIKSGGPQWWHENYKGISNVFSIFSIKPRMCHQKADIFRGLLGIFSGLFTPEEVERDLNGSDLAQLSSAFLKQLSIKTGIAWSKLAISRRSEKTEWGWMAVSSNVNRQLTSEYFSGVFNLGLLRQDKNVNAIASTGISGSPRKYIKILRRPEEKVGFDFVFKGCNGGKEAKTGIFMGQLIPTTDHSITVGNDETGRILVQCATILGSIMDPSSDVVEYRKRLLHKLQPHWTISDPDAKPTGWVDRCVSGSSWENPSAGLRIHNMSMSYRMPEITHCDSRLENEITARTSCEVRVNCGCTIIAPFSLVFEAVAAIEGTSLGAASANLDDNHRIVLRDGLGLLEVGDMDMAFDLVAFGGDIDYYRSSAESCRTTRIDRPIHSKLSPPVGRALVKENFTHPTKLLASLSRDYGYVDTNGAGNLLICRNSRVAHYEIIGVCIDDSIANKKANHSVTIR